MHKQISADDTRKQAGTGADRTLAAHLTACGHNIKRACDAFPVICHEIKGFLRVQHFGPLLLRLLQKLLRRLWRVCKACMQVSIASCNCLLQSTASADTQKLPHLLVVICVMFWRHNSYNSATIFSKATQSVTQRTSCTEPVLSCTKQKPS